VLSSPQANRLSRSDGASTVTTTGRCPKTRGEFILVAGDAVVDDFRGRSRDAEA